MVELGMYNFNLIAKIKIKRLY